MVPRLSRLHHIVPRFYLDGFAEDRRIGTVRLPGNKRFVQSTKSASAVKDFYTISQASDESDVFEKALAELEGDAAPVFKRLGDGEWPLNPASREILATFMAVQFLRGPSRRRQIEQLMALVTQALIGFRGRDSVEEYAQQELGMSLTSAEADAIWEAATQPGGPPIRMTAAGHAGELAESLPIVIPYFIGRPWVLIRFGRRSLITSDTPVALIPGRDVGPFSGVGVGTAEAMTFALSRKMGLVLVNPERLVRQDGFGEISKGSLDSTANPSTIYASMFNDATVRNAREWLFHHPDDADLVPADLHDPVREEIQSTMPDFRANQSPK